MPDMRGSEKLMLAWKARLTEDSVGEIARHLDDVPATVEKAQFHGGDQPSGLSLSLSYTADEIPYCGNTVQFYLDWLAKHGGGYTEPPRIIINGIPFPEWLRLELDFGRVGHDVRELGHFDRGLGR